MAETPPIFLEEYLKLHPADLADRLQRLSVDEACELVQLLPRGLGAATLQELDKENFLEVADGLSTALLVALLIELPPNAAADLIGDLPLELRRDILATLPEDHFEPIRMLLRYPEDTAGGIMSDRFLTLRDSMTVDQVREMLRGHADEERTQDVGYLYVTDTAQRLVGIVSLRDLVFGRGERTMSQIMNRDVKFLRVDDDQEAIAQRFEHYHYLGLPVLESEGRMVGVVKASDALRIAQEEATEDMQLMVGLSGEERALTPWRRSIGRRLPWLYLNLATAFLAAAVVAFFEGTIAKWTALAIFLPVVAGQGGNAGMQTLTVIIRDMALGELSPGDGRKALFKELTLAMFNGLALGFVVGLGGWLWQGSPRLGVVVGAAMILTQIVAALAGVLIPFGLKWFKIDPALASSIFLTTVTDVAGFFFFLGLAALAMRWLGG